MRFDIGKIQDPVAFLAQAKDTLRNYLGTNNDPTDVMDQLLVKMV